MLLGSAPDPRIQVGAGFLVCVCVCPPLFLSFQGWCAQFVLLGSAAGPRIQGGTPPPLSSLGARQLCQGTLALSGPRQYLFQV